VTAGIPPRVARGQTIGVVAPGGPVRSDRLHRGLACLGDAFAVRLADSLGEPRVPGTPDYLSAPDEIRAAELNRMLGDPDIRAIILARGGYGAMRILPMLDPDLLRRDPKPIVGFSDATALLAWAYRAGVRGIHGPMIAQLGDLPAADAALLIRVLTEPTALGERPWQLAMHGTGRRTGPLVAANLTLASMLVGTLWPVPLAGSIAILEDIGARPYEIDRYLTQLALTGALTGAAAAIIGDLVRCHDPLRPGAPRPEGDPNAESIATMRERLGSIGLPVAVGAPIGHGQRNEAVPFGAMAELDFDRGTLAILEPAVS
jgi:muramoyltetrapeptide carboxypeptidase